MTTVIITADRTAVIFQGNPQTFPTPAGMLGNRNLEAAVCDQFAADVLIVDRQPQDGETPESTGWLTRAVTLDYDQRRDVYLHTGFLPQLQADDMVLRHVAGDHQPFVEDYDRDACLQLVIRRLVAWRELTGVDYHTHPAVAAIVAMKRHTHPAPRWILRNHTGYASGPFAGDGWWTPPAPIVDLHAGGPDGILSTTWDRRGAYLASAAAVELPYRQLRQTGYDYDPACGYYRVSLANTPLARYYAALLAQSADPTGDGTVWVCHPTLRVLSETASLVEVVDSWTTGNLPGKEHGRILRPWAEKWRDALAGFDALASDQTIRDTRAALKQGYTQALGGLLTVKAGTIYRPDWRHMIIDHNRAHMLRIIARMWHTRGVLPLEIKVDAITYEGEPSDAIDETIGVGPRIGNMRTVTVNHRIPIELPSIAAGAGKWI